MSIDDHDQKVLEFVLKDNKAMKVAGGKLAEAAIRVVSEGDGCHRLALAISSWCQTIADEGGRPFSREGD